ncbi:MAG: DUF4838 domain-containing protein [Bacteroidetes bacterium]|nr:DUF4838 domain-containing protein [Bacteroidota bacterium]
MWFFKRFSILLPILLLILGGCSAGTPRTLKADGGYVITSAGDAGSERWAEYLFTHLSKRITDTTAVAVIMCNDSEVKNFRGNYKVIYLEMTEELKDDYCIEHSEKQLYISFSENSTALWLVYQLIGNIAEEDNRFQAHDVPPAVIDFTTGCKKFDFVYREPYFAPNLDPEYASVIGTNNVEVDWGLWGHNLAKVIGKIAPEDNDKMYALVEGERNRNQLCFSSSLLFDLTGEYIRDNYGKGDDKSYRFMIMPEDNNLVCMCPLCSELGNTENNATPAVTRFIGKLAEKFPMHQFFITAYGTTVSLPKHRLPKNVNVFLSTIELPKGIELTDDLSEVQEFKKQIEEWKNKTENVYLWDYASNFDDYLTPLPILYGLQKQLKFFKKLGVKGIFLNASGYDYSPFDDVKTLVSAALMMNVNTDVDKLVRKFFKKEYPVSHTLLSDYYLQLERDFSSKNIPYNMYGGMRETVNTYLNVGDFVRFYDALEKLLSDTEMEEVEREKLQKLHTALSYTRLQVAYVQGAGEWGYANREKNKMIVKPEMKRYVQALEKFREYPDMKRYKEAADGLLSDYVNEWKQLIAKGSFVNELIGTPIKVLSAPDEGFEKADLLNDGTLGFALDYHQGWYLSANDLRVGFSAENLRHVKTIKFRFLNNERHGILPPEKVILIIDGEEAGVVLGEKMKNSGNIVEGSIAVNLSKARDIELKFVRKQAKKSVIGCDEIVF